LTLSAEKLSHCPLFRTEVFGSISSVDSSQEQIGVDHLETKVFTYENVLLRTSDMKTCEVLCDLAETISHSQ
jgi:hypothetical protein